MTDLSVCRWREHMADGSLWCRSEKYVAPPNRVVPAFCRACCYRDHEPATAPPAPDPPASHAAIAVATLYTPEIAQYGWLSSQVLAAYARRHAYQAVIATAPIDASRPPSWSKLLLAERHLARNPACQWLMWFDADAVVTNPTRRVEDLIGEDVDFLVAEDLLPSPMNLGVFLIRNCLAALELLRRAYAKVQYIHHSWWEQPAVVEALREGAGALRSRIVPRRLFNAFAGEHRAGDFVLHFAGCSPEAKLAGVRAAVAAAWADVGGGREAPLPDRQRSLRITCILTSHRKPRFVHDAVRGVLAQSHAAWQLVIVDSGDLLGAGAFAGYQADPRISVVASGETPAMRGTVCLQSRAINECFRRGLVQGDLVCYLSDDDVYDPHIFAAWLAAAQANPDQQAWYGPADRCEVRRDGSETKVGDIATVGLAGRGGICLDCKADGMQVCHRRALNIPWPEDPAVAWHADGVFMDALGRTTSIHPIPTKVGRLRHTTDSTFTRPAT